MGLSKPMAQDIRSPAGRFGAGMILRWPQAFRLSDNQFYEFCRANKAWRIERTAQGDGVIMAPTGGETSWRNSRLITRLSLWADGEGSGVVFDSSAGFILPNGAIRSPDVSWLRRSRLAALTADQKARFMPLCPDFVIELRSPSDRLRDLQDKMQEYLDGLDHRCGHRRRCKWISAAHPPTGFGSDRISDGTMIEAYSARSLF